MLSRREILTAVTAVLSLDSPLTAREIASQLASSGVHDTDSSNKKQHDVMPVTIAAMGWRCVRS